MLLAYLNGCAFASPRYSNLPKELEIIKSATEFIGPHILKLHTF